MNESIKKVIEFCKSTKGEWFLKNGYKVRHKKTGLCPICQYAKVSVGSTWDSFAWHNAAREANLNVDALFTFVMAADNQIEFSDWANHIAAIRKELLLSTELGIANSN